MAFITFIYGCVVKSDAEDGKQGLETCQRLGSLAVKRVLGKDETPGSNPGLGSFCRTLLVRTLYEFICLEHNAIKTALFH